MQYFYNMDPFFFFEFFQMRLEMPFHIHFHHLLNDPIEKLDIETISISFLYKLK